MKISIKDIDGSSTSEIDVPFEVIDNGKGTQAVHDVVVAYRAAQRSGTACTKTVGEVAGSNQKPWRQKGTGRARAGSKRSPIWTGGGVTHGPRPRYFGKSVNKQTRQLALRKALGERIKLDDVIVLDSLTVDSPKTKNLAELLGKLGLVSTTLIVTEQTDKNLNLASRNIPNVEVCSSNLLNTYQVLRSDKIVITRAALEKLGERLASK